MEVCWGCPGLPESIKSREALRKIEFVVFWKQKKQESIEQIEFVVFWMQKSAGKLCNKVFGALD